MKWNLILWIGLSVIGFIMIALPDQGPRIISFSSRHGPALRDTIGVTFVLAGYWFLVLSIWKGRAKVLLQNGTKTFSLVLVMTGFGYGLICASVLSDFNFWWAVGIFILLIVHTWCLLVIKMDKND